jgi:hypothetical protein
VVPTLLDEKASGTAAETVCNAFHPVQCPGTTTSGESDTISSMVLPMMGSKRRGRTDPHQLKKLVEIDMKD